MLAHSGRAGIERALPVAFEANIGLIIRGSAAYFLRGTAIAHGRRVDYPVDPPTTEPAMQFVFQSCLISTCASIDDGRIVANARIFSPASDGSFDDDVHDLCLDENFIDEHEALTFARERAMLWVEEHCVSAM